MATTEQRSQAIRLEAFGVAHAVTPNPERCREAPRSRSAPGDPALIWEVIHPIRPPRVLNEILTVQPEVDQLS